MFHGTLEAIYIGATKTGPMQRVETARAIVGVGLEGDRYGSGAGTFSKGNPNEPGKQVTLIEAEALEAAAREYEIAIEPAQTRRNLLTRGVPLNHLVGQQFMVGQVRLRGIRLCEPSGHLEGLTVPGIRKALVHRGGLRAEILKGGTLRTGDAMQPSGQHIASAHKPRVNGNRVNTISPRANLAIMTAVRLRCRNRLPRPARTRNRTNRPSGPTA